MMLVLLLSRLLRQILIAKRQIKQKLKNTARLLPPTRRLEVRSKQTCFKKRLRLLVWRRLPTNFPCFLKKGTLLVTIRNKAFRIVFQLHNSSQWFEIYVLFLKLASVNIRALCSMRVVQIYLFQTSPLYCSTNSLELSSQSLSVRRVRFSRLAARTLCLCFVTANNRKAVQTSYSKVQRKPDELFSVHGLI